MAEIIWKDRKRHLGLPLSFTCYSMSEDRLFLNTGILNLKEEEVLLYRVRDVTLSRSLWQRLFGMGTVCIKSSDVSMPHLDLKNIARSRQVKELISDKVEEAKLRRKIRTTELLGAPDGDVHNAELVIDDDDHD